VLDRSFCKSKGGKSRRNLGRTVSTAHALIGEQGLEEEEKGKKKDGLDSVGRVSLAGDLDPRKRIHAYSRRSLGKTKPKKGESVTGEACVCLSLASPAVIMTRARKDPCGPTKRWGTQNLHGMGWTGTR
jgi:hypothetical protein